jgi:hypothetical protein
MPQEVIPVLVSFHTPRWIKVALRSYHHYFPADTVVVVDNNPDEGDPGWDAECEAERRWLAHYPWARVLKNESADKRHGAGIDVAVEYCRSMGAECLLHFEPDCLISGVEWYDELWRGIDQGAWMCGAMRQCYGPIHPTPSMWRVQAIAASFADQPRGSDPQHPRYAEVFDYETLMNRVRDESADRGVWWTIHWDTGQKNWFEAAVRDRAVLAGATTDFRHFFCGSSHHRNHPAFTEDAAIQELLRD